MDTLAEAWAAGHGGANLWADKRVRFLDPCTKSGVFLRAITSRLTEGLAQQILQEGGQAVPQASAAAAEKPEINTGETQEPKIVENARKKSEESTQPG